MIKKEVIYTLVYGVIDAGDSTQIKRRLIAAIPTNASADEDTIRIAYDSYYEGNPVDPQFPDQMRERYYTSFCIAYRQENPTEVNNIMGYFGAMNLLRKGEVLTVFFNRHLVP